MNRFTEKYSKKWKFIFAFVALTSCQALPPDIEFRRVKIGNSKADVVETIGSPVREERKYGRDWWYYRLDVDGKTKNRMVVFEKGKVIYAGRVTTPKYAKDAESLDKEHEISNQGLELLPPKEE